MHISANENKMSSFKIKQFSKEIVHLGIAKSSLDLHMLHDFKTDGLEWGETQKQLGEALRGNRIHGLGTGFQALQNLLLENLHPLLRCWTESFGIC